MIERAKGVLMERRSTGRKVVDVSEALVRSHTLLREKPG